MRKLQLSIVLLSMLMLQSQSMINAGPIMQRIASGILTAVGALCTARGMFLMKEWAQNYHNYYTPSLSVPLREFLVGEGAILCVPSIILMGAGIYIFCKSFSKKDTQHVATQRQ